MADNSDQVNQDEVDELLNQSRAGAEGDSASQDPSTTSPAADMSGAFDPREVESLLGQQAAGQISGAVGEGGESVGQDDINYLLDQAEQALASIDQPVQAVPEGVSEFRLEDFTGSTASTTEATLDLIRDVELDLKIELGRTHMHLEEVLKLRKGAVVPLDKLAGDPVDIYVNGRLIARGEVLVLNDNFCVRVGELIVGESAVA